MMRVMGDEIKEVRGSDTRALWAMVGTVDFTLSVLSRGMPGHILYPRRIPLAAGYSSSTIRKII